MMATRKGIHISGNYAARHKLYAFFNRVPVLIFFERSHKIALYIHILKSTTIRHGVLLSGYVELIPTAVCCSN